MLNGEFQEPSGIITFQHVDYKKRLILAYQLCSLGVSLFVLTSIQLYWGWEYSIYAAVATLAMAEALLLFYAVLRYIEFAVVNRDFHPMACFYGFVRRREVQTF